MNKAISNELKVYTPQDLVEILKLHEHTIRRYIREGKIKSINTGTNSKRVSHKMLVEFINGSK